MLNRLAFMPSQTEGPDKDRPDHAEEQNEQKAAWVKNLGLFSAIVGDMIGCTGAGVGLGYFAMKKWNAPWWVLFITTTAGLVLAMVRLYRISQLSDGQNGGGKKSD